MIDTLIEVAARPLMLDLYCGEGGAGTGYHQAGFDVFGVDLNQPELEPRRRPRPKPLRRYPFPCVAADAVDVLDRLVRGELVEGHALDDFAAIHASPPCQGHSSITVVRGHPEGYPDLIEPTRNALEKTGLPWVIENVERAPLRDPVVLCGSMFDPPMDVQRHRLFETNWPLATPMWPCRHKLWAPRFIGADERHRKRGRLMRVVPVYGGTRHAGEGALRARVMEIDWMTVPNLSEAIPPRYTRFIGEQLFEYVRQVVAA